jgi:hypothetical protein
MINKVFWVVTPFSLKRAQHFRPVYFWDSLSTLTMEVICSFKMSGSSQTARVTSQRTVLLLLQFNVCKKSTYLSMYVYMYECMYVSVPISL